MEKCCLKYANLDFLKQRLMDGKQQIWNRVEELAHNESHAFFVQCSCCAHKASINHPKRKLGTGGSSYTPPSTPWPYNDNKELQRLKSTSCIQDVLTVESSGTGSWSIHVLLVFHRNLLWLFLRSRVKVIASVLTHLHTLVHASRLTQALRLLHLIHLRHS